MRRDPNMVVPTPDAMRAAESAYLGSDAYEADLTYWKIRLHGLPGPLVDADHNDREPARSSRSKCISLDIGQKDFERLKSAATSLGSSAPILALGLAYVAVSRLQGVNDIVIELTPHYRMMEASEPPVDFPMTIMPFRMTFEYGNTIENLPADTRGPASKWRPRPAGTAGAQTKAASQDASPGRLGIAWPLCGKP